MQKLVKYQETVSYESWTSMSMSHWFVAALPKVLFLAHNERVKMGQLNKNLSIYLLNKDGELAFHIDCTVPKGSKRHFFCHFHFFMDYDITPNYASAVKFLEVSCNPKWCFLTFKHFF